MNTISGLKFCTNPSGDDSVPILDQDGGIGGKPKTKQLKLSTLSTLLSQNVTGIIRSTTQVVSSKVLSLNESEDLLLPLCKTFILINVNSNIPGRIRLYQSSLYLEKDRDRDFDTDPSIDDGVIFEGQFDETLLSFPIEPTEITVLKSDNCFCIFDSRSIIAQKAIVKFTYLPLEV
jgi:hypothetical protein